MIQPDHIFWAERWRDARRGARKRKNTQSLAMINYTIYLAEVFSFMFERGRITR